MKEGSSNAQNKVITASQAQQVRSHHPTQIQEQATDYIMAMHTLGKLKTPEQDEERKELPRESSMQIDTTQNTIAQNAGRVSVKLEQFDADQDSTKQRLDSMLSTHGVSNDEFYKLPLPLKRRVKPTLLSTE